MKLLIRFTFIYLLLLTACVKDNDVSMDFKITGVNNKTLVRGYGVTLPLKVFYLGGEKNDVTISAEGVPSGISISFDNSTGEPDFELNATVQTEAGLSPGDYKMVIKGESEDGKIFDRELTITITDPANKIPQITLAGSTNIIHTLNDPFMDPGYYATDEEDGDITSQVIITGSVNYNNVGNYILRYVVYDSDGDSTFRQRNVSVINSNAHMQGLYNCTTEVQNGPTFTWTSYIATSSTTNFNFVLNKISDCLGSLINPMELELIPFGANNVSLPAQVVYGSNTSQPSHCDPAYHQITGSGTVTYVMPYTFIITYTDLYEDSNGLQHTYVKTDTYVKVP